MEPTLPDSDDDDVGARRICCDCIGEEFLSAEVIVGAQEASCFYCGNKRPSLSIEEVADRIEGVIEARFERTASGQNMFGGWERSGEPIADVIAQIALIEPEPAEDVRQLLFERHYDKERYEMGEEGPFDADAHYEERGPNDIELRLEWSAFERTLKSEARYFNRAAEAVLKFTFADLFDLTTEDGQPVIVKAGPSATIASLFRARAFHSDAELEKALETPEIGLGPPPSRLARAGRLNASGVSIFYGALEPFVRHSGANAPSPGERQQKGARREVSETSCRPKAVHRGVPAKSSLRRIRAMERATERVQRQLRRPVPLGVPSEQRSKVRGRHDRSARPAYAKPFLAQAGRSAGHD